MNLCVKKLLCPIFGALLLLPAAGVMTGRADEDGRALPFDPAKISRLSLDGIPRSLSIRQGADVWLGYELEKAVVSKVWQAPKGKSGLVVKGFKARSAGTAWFENKTDEVWQLRAAGKAVPLTVRYLGCTQLKGYFELRWELGHSDRTVRLTERIPTAPANDSGRAYRELRVDSLKAGGALVLSPAYRDAWVLTGPAGKPVKTLTGSAWHRLSLP
ncbi:MAG: hypothetical protein ACKVHO_01440 [Verrucomicrobiia bacterium]|jgi:hypothetical protein